MTHVHLLIRSLTLKNILSYGMEGVNPNTLEQRLPYFGRFIETLEKLLRSQ